MAHNLPQPDLGGAPMPGEGLDMSFLKSLGDDGPGGGLTVQSSNMAGAPPASAQGGDSQAQATRKLKPNVQPIARDDFSAEGMERMYEEQRRRQLELEREEQMAAERYQQQQIQAPQNPTQVGGGGDSFFTRYQTAALWIGAAALLVTIYLLYKQQRGGDCSKAAIGGRSW